MTQASKQPAHARRRFLTDLARGATGAGLLCLGVALYARRGAALPAQALRPPGALPEPDFQASCVRCGLCVRACPYDILTLATLAEPAPLGTPYFTARTGPCEMCEDIPCTAACPTGALAPDLKRIDDARMGLAVLVDQETCLNFQGLRCDVCYRVCPAIDQAITLELQHNRRSGKHALFIPTVHSDACTGCGKCEQACVLPVAAIKVIPVGLAKGEPGGHYRLGWEEKHQAGHSLVSPDRDRQYHLPEGLSYDHAGEGLRTAPRPQPDDSHDAARSVPGSGR